MEYDYPDADFSIHFPAAPGVTGGLYETGAGMFVGARIYSLQVAGKPLHRDSCRFVGHARTKKTPSSRRSSERMRKAMSRSIVPAADSGKAPGANGNPRGRFASRRFRQGGPRPQMCLQPDATASKFRPETLSGCHAPRDAPPRIFRKETVV
jgi:hypothetical protein